MKASSTKLEFDYTQHAKFYEYRPNYAERSIDMLMSLARSTPPPPRTQQRLNVADIGAGTGNLTVMLSNRGADVWAIEPNDAMREIGVRRTKDVGVYWIKTSGVDTTLENESMDLVTFGSSFNVLDRDMALRESHRILKKDGYFSCMWNHRDLQDDIQKQAEVIIETVVPGYNRGVRRESQRDKLQEHRHLFDNVVYIEEDYYVHQTLDNYINAWRSVRNKFWDMDTEQGRSVFDRIVEKFSEKLPREFDIRYQTKIWAARKI